MKTWKSISNIKFCGIFRSYIKVEATFIFCSLPAPHQWQCHCVLTQLHHTLASYVAHFSSEHTEGIVAGKKGKFCNAGWMGEGSTVYGVSRRPSELLPEFFQCFTLFYFVWTQKYTEEVKSKCDPTFRWTRENSTTKTVSWTGTEDKKRFPAIWCFVFNLISLLFPIITRFTHCFLYPDFRHVFLEEKKKFLHRLSSPSSFSGSRQA